MVVIKVVKTDESSVVWTENEKAYLQVGKKAAQMDDIWAEMMAA